MKRKVKFDKICHQIEKAAVFGTGESLKGFDCLFPTSVSVIGVNKAHLFLPCMDFWFSLDTRVTRRIPKEKGTIYYAAIPEDFKFRQVDRCRYIKRIVGEGYKGAKPFLSETKEGINTGNSAWGAFQLAILMGAKKIGLFGVDGFGGYVYGGQPMDLIKLMPSLFESSKRQLNEKGIEVRNGSPNSTVDCFPRMTREEVRDWLIK